MSRKDIPRIRAEEMISLGLRPGDTSRFLAAITPPLRVAITEAFRGQLVLITEDKPRSRGDYTRSYVGKTATAQAIRTLLLADLLCTGEKLHSSGWGLAGKTAIVPTLLCVAVVLQEADGTYHAFPEDVIDAALTRYNERMDKAPADALYTDTSCASVWADKGTWEYAFLEQYAKEVGGDCVRFIPEEPRGMHGVVKARAHARVPAGVAHTLKQLSWVMHKHDDKVYAAGVAYGRNVLMQLAAGDIGVNLEGRNGER